MQYPLHLSRYAITKKQKYITKFHFDLMSSLYRLGWDMYDHTSNYKPCRPYRPVWYVPDH